MTRPARDDRAESGAETGTDLETDERPSVDTSTDSATSRTNHSNDPLLTVNDLKLHYPITEGWLRREVGRARAVDGVSFECHQGEIFGLVGESGSGKTSLAHTILGLEEPTAGEIVFDGESVFCESGRVRPSYRRRVQLVVQDPNEAFNPRMTIGTAVAEPLALHGMDDPDRRRQIVEDLLARVRLAPEDADRYPHEFSGGEKQRIAIARALIVNPDLIVADEPTSALDTRTQAAVLELFEAIRDRYGVSILFISHDINVVRRFCDRVGVMYAGEFVETGPTETVLESPAHPYTRVLLDSVPSLEPGVGAAVTTLTDVVPDPADPPSGCRFHPRCPELIPPNDADLSMEAWRRVAAFVMTVERGDQPPIAQGENNTESETTASDPAASDTDEPSNVDPRARFDLPAETGDATLDKALDDAFEALKTDQRERAREILSSALPTICARESPSESMHDGSRVRCHRYDDLTDAPPIEWTPRASDR